ncbi:MAG: DMSO/selenate family reductase complex A subunit [Brooklawnia sp.]|jgi:anaerobic dimethyl sulfoxide reductase subunit A
MSSTTSPSLKRRSFMKWSGAVAGAGALMTTGTTMFSPVASQAAPGDGMPDADNTVWSACLVNCGSRCAVRLQVKDGTLARVLPDNTGTDDLHSPQLRACVRGRSIRRRVYNPDRLTVPLRRKAGTMRGDGQWEEISWDEALDEIADNMKRIIAEYGNEALYNQYGSGVTGGNITRDCFRRFFNSIGGCLGYYGNYSNGQLTFAMPFTYGIRYESNSLLDTRHSQLIVHFGNNPVETRMSGGGNMWNAQKTRMDHPVRTIVIDPRYSETVMGVADEWIPIRPGGDTALVNALAYEIIRQDLHDQEFLDKYCLGFDEEHMPEGIPAGNSYKSYIMGTGPDGIAKTPEWASPITGIPVERIKRLAVEIATAKPCAIFQGWGPQRQANGENATRAIIMLPLLTGNVGIPGGSNGSREGTIRFPLVTLPGGMNPIQKKISHFMWSDAIERGPEMTATQDGIQGADRLEVPIKFIMNVAGNALINQHADSGRSAELLRDDTKCEFICVIDNHMTSSARFADIVLPGTTAAEEWDVIATEYSGDHAALITVNQAIEPVGEARSHYDICVELAKRMGVEQEFTEGRTQQEWAAELFRQTREAVPDMPDYATMQSQGVYRVTGQPDTFVSMQSFREDPEANPLQTPSGKIEIFSERLWELSKSWTFRDPLPGDEITALPEHLETWEGPEEAATNEQYPLQCIGHHYKGRTHSSYGSVDWLKEAHPQEVWVNPVDAEPRGIADGDMVEVFNDRGRIRIPANVTVRILPGVLSVPQGAWYQPDADGVDVGGCVNTLTTWHPSPLAKSNAQHTTLVQIEKA